MALLAGCGSGRAILPFSFETASLVVPDATGGFASTEAAVSGIAAILTRTFKLPMPQRVSVFVYPGRLAFERGLILDAGLAEAQAAELSGFAIGIGGRAQLLLNAGGPDRTEREWLRLIAHELTHVSQTELAGGEGRGEQWLAEGMAEWVAFSTLEQLGLDSMTRRRQRAAAGVRAHATLIATGLSLEAHGTSTGFTGWHLREGSLPTYQLAFLLADYLIERRGLDRLRGYFGSFARSRDRQGNFRLAFGGTLEEFETDVLAYLRMAAGPLSASALP